MRARDALDRLDQRVLGDAFRHRPGDPPRPDTAVVLRAAVQALLRLVALVVALLGVIIVLGIVFELAPTNSANPIPAHLSPAAEALSKPFHDIFTEHSRDVRVGVNWGIAAAVYFVVAMLVRALATRLGRDE